MASNPEFLREGSAIEDFRRPDRVVVGCDTERAREVMREVYRPLYLNETPIALHQPRNQRADQICRQRLPRHQDHLHQRDGRASARRSAATCRMWRAASAWTAASAANSSMPARALAAPAFPRIPWPWCKTARDAGAPSQIVEAVVAVNDARKLEMAKKIETAFGGVKGKTIAVLGLTFKPNTDDMRDAPSLVIVPHLQAGRRHQSAPMIRKAARKRAKHLKLEFCDDAYDGAGRRRRCGDPDRMERIPRAGFRQGESAAEEAADGGSAQHLPARPDGAGRLPLCQRRPRRRRTP